MFSWKQISQTKIFSALAPMEDVTDVAFRSLLTELKAKPDIFFTEFLSLEGLYSKGRDQVSHRLKYKENQMPIIAQVWGTNPLLYNKAGKEMKALGFDGMDINMGCPAYDVVKIGACSALINNPELAKEIILQAKTSSEDCPISVKTRLGFNEIQTDTWIRHILEQKPDALTVHLRTVKELSNVPAHYEEMIKISKIRDLISPETVLICNGDIETIEQGEKLCKENNFQGYMIGRGIFKNPLVFKNIEFNNLSIDEKISILKRHVEIFEENWETEKNFAILKKYFKIYISAFDGAADLRAKFMECKSYEEVNQLVNSLKTNS